MANISPAHDAERKERRRLQARERRKNPAVREAERLAAAKYRATHPERAREANRRGRARPKYLRRQYGMTIEKYDTMVKLLGGRCAICGRVPDLLHVDHHHESGFVRGLLCGQCNKGLGLFGEDIERLQAAIEYLSTTETIRQFLQLAAS